MHMHVLMVYGAYIHRFGQNRIYMYVYMVYIRRVG